MPKVLNKVTHIPLTHIQDDKLNAHMGNMNNEGWELMSVAVESIGIEEKFIMFWRKELPELALANEGKNPST